MSALPPHFDPSETGASFATPLGVGRWHDHRRGLLSAALEQVRRQTPVAARLAEAILPRLPRRVLASQNLRTATTAPFSSVLPLDEAAICPWVSLDSETHWNVLAFDIDHTEALELVEELPPHVRPWLAIDPYSGRAHAFILLATPVLVSRKGSEKEETKAERARSDKPRISFKARRLADVAQAMMAAALRATPLRHRALLKNPLGRVDALVGQQLRRVPQPATPAMWDAWQAAGTGLVWHTVPGAGPVELGAIIATLADEYGEAVAEAPTGIHFRRRRGEPSAAGRNCSLFDQVRWFAYDNDERDGGAILAEATRVNSTFAEPLPASEVAATARSITKFMRRSFRPRTRASSANRRDQKAGAELVTREDRQALAGRVTAAARAAETDVKIAAGMSRLRTAGKPMTQAAIAAEAGVSIRTVKGRWADIRPMPIMVQDAPLSGNAPSSPHPQIGEQPPAALDTSHAGELVEGMVSTTISSGWLAGDRGRGHESAPAKKTKKAKADDGRQRTPAPPVAGQGRDKRPADRNWTARPRASRAATTA